MKAVRYRAGGGPPRLGRLEDDHVVDAGPAGFRGFDGSDEAWETITSGAGEQHGLQDVRLLAPSEPQKVIAVGLNYQSHIAETSLSRPDEPFGFAIWPNALIGHEQEIVVPQTLVGANVPILRLTLSAHGATVNLSGITVTLMGSAPVNSMSSLRLVADNDDLLHTLGGA